jgi:hypothetical protein
MPDDRPHPSIQRHSRRTDRLGYLSRDQRRELELLERLSQAPDPVVRFRPSSKTMRGYQVFTTGTVWMLEHLARRGWVELVERTPAGPEEEQWWDEIAASMTASGRSEYMVLRARAVLEEGVDS